MIHAVKLLIYCCIGMSLNSGAEKMDTFSVSHINYTYFKTHGFKFRAKKKNISTLLQVLKYCR